MNTQQTAKHTPGPWKIAKQSPLCTFIQSADGGPIADVDGSDSEAKANAEFIVRACNSHYELVEALKSALKANPYGVRIDGKWGDWRDEVESVLSSRKGELIV